MARDLVRRSMELFAAECLPTLKSWGREPVTSRASD